MNQESPEIINEDPTLLFIKGGNMSGYSRKSYIKNLADTICSTFAEHEKLTLRCVGASSLNNAIKSFIVARGEATKRGMNLVLVPSFKTVEFTTDNGAEEKTAISLEVLDIDV